MKRHAGQRLFDLWVRAEMLLVFVQMDTCRTIFTGGRDWAYEIGTLMSVIAQVDIGSDAAREQAIPIADDFATQLASVAQSLDESLVSFSGALPNDHSVADLRAQLKTIIA